MIRERRQNVELTDETSPAVPAADISAEHREAVRTLVADLASLPEAQRSALVLHEMSGLSHEEVSEALQCSPRASRQTIYEARLALQDLKEGRAMDCDQIRSVISDGDGRVIRGRKVKSHLRDCRRCADFALANRQRRTQLGWLAPPLPAAAASGLIATVLGGGTGTGGALGAGAGAMSVLGGSAVLKSIGIVGAGLAIGVGGAGVAGVDLPGGSSERASQSGAETTAGSDQAGAQALTGGTSESSRRDASAKGPSSNNEARKDANAKNQTKDVGSSQRSGSTHGRSGDEAPGTPAHSNAGGATPSTPAHSNAGGDRISSDSTASGAQAPEHAQAGGNSDKDSN
jgi:hypothetical protein